MPIEKCTRNGKLGFRSGPSGKCFIGRGARAKAERQLRAIKASQNLRQDDLLDAVFMAERRRASLNKRKINRGKKSLKWLPPIPMERMYQKELLKFVREMEIRVNQIVIENIPSLVEERDNVVPENARNDGYSDGTERLMESLRVSIRKIEFDKILTVTLIFKETNDWNDRQWKKVMRSVLGVDIFQREPWLIDTTNSFINENVALINSLEDEYLKSIEQSLNAGLRGGLSSKSIAKDIRSRTMVTRNKVIRIGRDQVSKVNGQLTQLRQTNLGIEKYIWRTSDDQRVRESHRRKDDRIFDWNNPPIDTGHPGQDVQCRCIAEPIFDPVIEELTV